MDVRDNHSRPEIHQEPEARGRRPRTPGIRGQVGSEIFLMLRREGGDAELVPASQGGMLECRTPAGVQAPGGRVPTGPALSALTAGLTYPDSF